MDSCFALIEAHQHGIAVGSMNEENPRVSKTLCAPCFKFASSYWLVRARCLLLCVMQFLWYFLGTSSLHAQTNIMNYIGWEYRRSVEAKPATGHGLLTLGGCPLFRELKRLFILFTSSSPCRKDQCANLYFLQVIIVLIQVYNWEFRHHSTVWRCGLADTLYDRGTHHRFLQEPTAGFWHKIDHCFCYLNVSISIAAMDCISIAFQYWAHLR